MTWDTSSDRAALQVIGITDCRLLILDHSEWNNPMPSHSPVRLKIRAIPNAKRTEIVEILDDGTLRIRLAAPPVDGKANEALAEFLAETLGLRKSAVALAKGGKSRDKVWEISGMTEAEIRERLGAS